MIERIVEVLQVDTSWHLNSGIRGFSLSLTNRYENNEQSVQTEALVSPYMPYIHRSVHPIPLSSFSFARVHVTRTASQLFPSFLRELLLQPRLVS